MFVIKEKCSLFNTNIFNFLDLNTENGQEKNCTVNKLSFLENKPVEFDVLSKIHAYNKNGPSITILKWTCNHYLFTISKNGLTVFLYYSTESQV